MNFMAQDPFNSAAPRAPEAMQKPGYLFVLPWEPHHAGGVNQVVINLMDEMEAKGRFHPLLLVQSWEDGKARQLDADGRKTFYLRLREPWSLRSSVKSIAGFLLELPSALRQLNRLIKKENIAVVNLHYPTLAGWNFILLKLLGMFSGKIIISVHGLDLQNAQSFRGPARFLWKMLLKSGDSVVSCSDSLKQSVLSFCPGARCIAIYNGIAPARLLAEMESGYSPSPLMDGARYIINVGTFEHKKGQDVLISAFSTIADKFPDILLVLIGRDGPMHSELDTLIGDLGLANRVIMFKDMPHGKVSAMMKRAYLFALPSRIEPFGIVLLEAGLFGVPVIATKTGGVPEIISDGENGILVEPDDALALAREMAHVLENPTIGNAIGERLRQEVLLRFTWEIACEQYLALLE
jgi:glycosyltransferase involved in cell wall biosynthesis